MVSSILTWLVAAAANATEPTPGAVPLHFNWQPGLRCEVERTLDNLANPSAEQQRDQWTYWVSTGPRGLSVAVRDHRSIPGKRRDAVQLFNMKVQDAVHTARFAVSLQGEYLGIENAADVQARLEALREQSPNPTFYAQFLKMQTTEYFDSMYGDDWASLVGDWRGLALVPRVATRHRLKTSLAPVVLLNQTFDLQATLTLRGPQPCPGSAARRCVVLEVVIAPDEVELAEAIAKGVGNYPLPPGWRVTGVKKSMILEFEPDTMIPHRVVEEISGTAPPVYRVGEAKFDHRRFTRLYSCGPDGE